MKNSDLEIVAVLCGVVGIAKKLKISPKEFSEMMLDVSGVAPYMAEMVKARIDASLKNIKK